MSIINEALKKTELQREKETLYYPKRSKWIIFIFLSLGLIIAVFSSTYVFLPRPKPDSQPDQKMLRHSEENNLPLASLTPLDLSDKMPFSLELKGIAHSGEENWVIINDQIIKEGQSIKGAKVEEIFSDHIDITFEGKKFSLEVK